MKFNQDFLVERGKLGESNDIKIVLFGLVVVA